MRIRTLAAAMLVGAASATAVAQTPVERGRYLVTTILACGNCHTPKDAEGRPLEGRELAGGGLSFDLPFFAGTASNITPDRETGIGAWTDEEIARAITQGARPGHGRLPGTELAVVMWVNFYKALLPSDLAAVVSYLRSIPAVGNAVPQPVYRMPVRRETYPEAERGFTEADLRDPVRRGAYLATIGHCMECHTPTVKGRTRYDEALGKGGKAFLPSFVKGYPPAWQGSTSSNVTSHASAGLGGWSDAEIARAITRGVSRDGRALGPPMGYHWYAGLNAEDVAALVAWLRTVPARD
jgi:mono/diheme cytochrome c family protein